ncbi:MAG: hypothetical protein ACSHYC_22455 [Alphaproteobacteria bacterium]
MTQRFKEFVDCCIQSLTPLPLVHTTDWLVFRDLKDSDRILRPQMCPVFHEELTYLFYGKPCYRSHINSEPNSLSAFYNIGIVFDPMIFNRYWRAYPFDTGAFKNGFYKSSLHPGIEVNHFSITPTPIGAAKSVATFFETNENYFRGSLRGDLKPSASEIEVSAFLSIAGTRAQTSEDDRRSAIEVQIKHNIVLNSENVQAIILPEQLLDDTDIVSFITDELEAEALDYICPHARPSEDARAILTEAKRFCKSRGYL